jgi:hypothetical protein
MESVTTLLPQAGETISQVSFSWYDYILFCVMLSLSAFIGIYFGCFGTKQSSANEYLMGDKKMKVFPISVSLHNLRLSSSFPQVASHQYVRVPGAQIRQHKSSVRVVFVHSGPLLVLADHHLSTSIGVFHRHRTQHPLHHSGGVRRLHLLHHFGGVESCGLDRHAAVYHHHRCPLRRYRDRNQIGRRCRSDLEQSSGRRPFGYL